MERWIARLFLSIAVLSSLLTGCEPSRTLGLRKDAGTDSTAAAAYEENLVEQSANSTDSDDPTSLRSIFRANRLPGGLSREAREIERDSFNIQ